jgi:hypothetical protein
VALHVLAERRLRLRRRCGVGSPDVDSSNTRSGGATGRKTPNKARPGRSPEQDPLAAIAVPLAPIVLEGRYRMLVAALWRLRRSRRGQWVLAAGSGACVVALALLAARCSLLGILRPPPGRSRVETPACWRPQASLSPSGLSGSSLEARSSSSPLPGVPAFAGGSSGRRLTAKTRFRVSPPSQASRPKSQDHARHDSQQPTEDRCDEDDPDERLASRASTSSPRARLRLSGTPH